MLSSSDTALIAYAVKESTREIPRRGAAPKWSAQEVIGRIREVANEGNLAEVLPLLPNDLREQLLESFREHPSLKAVGYWCQRSAYCQPTDEELPDPAKLVRPDWTDADRLGVAEYLKAGNEYVHWRGFSYCRFSCGIPSTEMGSRCLTDGQWVWPEGLAHYIECHSVGLPEEFLVTMRSNHWKMPKVSEEICKKHLGGSDVRFWVEWGRKFSGAFTPVQTK